MDEHTYVIVVAFFAFVALAAALLVPIYLFLKREEKVAEGWTEQTISDSTPTTPTAKEEEL